MGRVFKAVFAMAALSVLSACIFVSPTQLRDEAKYKSTFEVNRDYEAVYVSLIDMFNECNLSAFKWGTLRNTILPRERRASILMQFHGIEGSIITTAIADIDGKAAPTRVTFYTWRNHAEAQLLRETLAPRWARGQKGCD